ncbi:MAG: phage holin family protein [Candidatus Promineifilaceae bacterium]|nr:phage holin family protein [Candidatus Promineifilaceae bacterium]
MKLILRILINAAAIWLTTLIVSGLNFSGDIISLIVVAIIFGLVNGLIRPIVKLFSLPITVVTLGLFTLVINAFMLWITVWLAPSLSLDGNILQNFVTVFLGALIISIISTILSWFLPD